MNHATQEHAYRRRPAFAARRLAHLEAQAREARNHGDAAAAASFDGAATRVGELLRSMGRCRRCGRTLTDPESVTAGIGPECRRKAR